MPKPSVYGKPGQGPTVIIQAMESNRRPAHAARAKLILDGRGLPDLQTDKDGVAVWHIGTSGTYGVPARHSYTYFATVTIDGSSLVKTGHASHFVPTNIVIQAPQKESAETRFMKRLAQPVKQRSSSQLLADIAWSSNEARKYLRGTKEGLQIIGWKQHVSSVDAFMGSLEILGDTADVVSSFDEIRLKPRNVLKVTAKAVTVVTVLYDIVDGYRKDDLEGVVRALGVNVLEIIIGLHPIGAMAVLGVHLAFGLASLTIGRPSASVISAVVRQTVLPEFNHIGSCPVVAAGKQYRVDVTKNPYAVKVYNFSSPLVDGLAFSNKHKGALVLVHGGIELPIPTSTTADAKRVKKVLDYVHVNGW